MLTDLYWVGNALEIAGAPPQLAILLPLAMAFYPAISAILYWYASRLLIARGWMAHRDVMAVMIFSLCWLGGEWMRGTFFTRFP